MPGWWGATREDAHSARAMSGRSGSTGVRARSQAGSRGFQWTEVMSGSIRVRRSLRESVGRLSGPLRARRPGRVLQASSRRVSMAGGQVVR
ncbi:hypothetical protein C2142_10050 [Streptomyces sp. CB01881]|nr:hypothetical protein C2142_10050 [Streptomyces sp. CB01881]